MATGALSPAELEILGTYLYGARRQSALSRGIVVDISLVQRWKAGARPVSARCASLIIALVRTRHLRRMHDERTRYLWLSETVSPAVRAQLLAHDR